VSPQRVMVEEYPLLHSKMIEAAETPTPTQASCVDSVMGKVRQHARLIGVASIHPEVFMHLRERVMLTWPSELLLGMRL